MHGHDIARLESPDSFRLKGIDAVQRLSFCGHDYRRCLRGWLRRYRRFDPLGATLPLDRELVRPPSRDLLELLPKSFGRGFFELPPGPFGRSFF